MMSMRLLDGDAVGRRDVHGAVVLDLDGDAGLGRDAADGLAARADDLADLVGLDRAACGCAARTATAPSRGAASASAILPRMWSRPVAWPGAARLVEDLARQALDLDVHLDGGDAVSWCRRS